jgi:hypothetical protein
MCYYLFTVENIFTEKNYDLWKYIKLRKTMYYAKLATTKLIVKVF